MGVSYVSRIIIFILQFNHIDSRVGGGFIIATHNRKLEKFFPFLVGYPNLPRLVESEILFSSLRICHQHQHLVQ